jgi:hypothetical protein
MLENTCRVNHPACIYFVITGSDTASRDGDTDLRLQDTLRITASSLASLRSGARDEEDTGKKDL